MLSIIDSKDFTVLTTLCNQVSSTRISPGIPITPAFLFPTSDIFIFFYGVTWEHITGVTFMISSFVLVKDAILLLRFNPPIRYPVGIVPFPSVSIATSFDSKQTES